MKRMLWAVGIVWIGFFGCTTPTQENQNQNQIQNKPSKFTLSVTASHGSVTLSPAGGTYDSGTAVTLIPSAASGYQFSGWSGDLTGTSSPGTVTMNANKSVAALFSVPSTGFHGTITVDSVWNLPANDYHIDGNLAINANVTWARKIKVRIDDGISVNVSGNGRLSIEEGVEVTLGSGSHFSVGYSTAGTLVARGSDSLPITFTRNSGVEAWGFTGGNAGGFVLGDRATSQTAFDHCIVEYATSGFNITQLQAVITNCKIRHNVNYGINFNKKAMPKDSASFTGDSITDNGGYPISIAAEGLSRLSGDTYMNGNTSEGIEVTGGNVTESGSWKKHDVPYIFSAYANLGSAAGVVVTINPGVLCKFNADAYLNVGYTQPATIIANGTDQDSIKFTSATAGAPWGFTGTNGSGFMFWDNTSTNTSLTHCVIDGALGGMYVGKTKIAVSYCTIRNSTGSGIIFSAKGSPRDSAAFIRNSISGSGDYGIKINASNLGKLSGTESCFSNGKGGIFVTGDTVNANATWKDYGQPYIVSGIVRIQSPLGTTVTIEHGTRIEFLSESYISVGYSQNGALIADGTAPPDDPHPETAMISFTRHTDGAYWGFTGNNGAGIMLWNGAAATTVLRNCKISNALAGVYVNTINAMTINRCSIGGNKTYGIGYYGSTVPITGITGNYAGDGPNPSGDLVNLNP